MELGSIAEFLSAGASIAAFAVSYMALKTAISANRQALEASRRDLSANVQAWWCVRKDKNTENKWGIAVLNSEKEPVVYRDVEIEQQGGKSSTSLNLKFLPPGLYFAEAKSKAFGWEFIKPVTFGELEPIARSDGYTICQISYTDPLGKNWEWTPENYLQEK